MTISLDCYPCFVRQTLEAARMAVDDERVHRQILDAVMERLTRLPLGATPPQVGQAIHRLIRERVATDDPYREVKQRYNALAMDMLPRLREMVLRSADPLRTAARLAIAGNVIDFGPSAAEVDLDEVVAMALRTELAVDDSAALEVALAGARSVLYLADNAGEIAFDRLLVEAIARRWDAEIAVVVRGLPVLNDATVADAAFAGLDVYARILPSGSDAPAVVLAECTPHLAEAFGAADVIIAKGQGNYESLSGEAVPAFFLLTAKCAVVARDLGVQIGAAVLMQGRGPGYETQGGR